MNLEWLYIVYGILLVVLFIWVIVHYFNPKRKDKIEKSKYRMLEDDEPQ